MILRLDSDLFSVNDARIHSNSTAWLPCESFNITCTQHRAYIMHMHACSTASGTGLQIMLHKACTPFTVQYLAFLTLLMRAYYNIYIFSTNDSDAVCMNDVLFHFIFKFISLRAKTCYTEHFFLYNHLFLIEGCP